METTKNRKTPEKRNLYLRIPEDRKMELKRLAKVSGMTMETYATAVLEDAIRNEDIFDFVKRRQK